MDPYKVLGVSLGATDDEIKRAYRNLSRKYHPDANVNNPNKEQAEEKFKEIQAAYDQIMKQKQQGYGTDGGDYGGFGGFGRRNGAYGGQSTESVEMQAAANYISNRCYKEALNVLSQVTNRTARWYYYSAIANAGMGNNVTAQEDAQTAVDMEPSNMEYRQLQQQLAYGGAQYQNMGGGYERPYSGGNWCLSMLLLNVLCSCCCPRV